MATAKNRKKASTAVSVDFTDVESGGGFVPEDDYVFEVSEVTKETSDNSGEDYLRWVLEIADGEHKGKKLFHNTSLQKQALFNLRGLLEALGYEIEEGAMDLDLDDLVGERGACSVVHEDYKGKRKARPVEFFTEAELENRSEPAPTKPAAKKAGGSVKAKAKEAEPEPAATKTKTKAKAKAKPEEPEYEVGQAVKFDDDDGDEQEGEITEIDGDDITVKVGKGKKAQEFVLEPGDIKEVVEAE